MRNLLLLAAVAVAPACAPSNAQVPTVDRDAALQLVVDDLGELAQSHDPTHWRRAYRHFDRYVEPHLSSSERLRLEMAFSDLRRELKLGPPEGLETSIRALQTRLQPQD